MTEVAEMSNIKKIKHVRSLAGSVRALHSKDVVSHLYGKTQKIKKF